MRALRRARWAFFLLLAITLLFGSDPIVARSTCGDGLIQEAEECDDGALVPGDGCSASCRFEICGNGIVDFGETCDDGLVPQFYNDGCIGCQLSTCGNSIVEPGEVCDGGPNCDGQCSLYPCTLDAECDDGLYCNGAERCLFNGCYPAESPVDCGDMASCTADFCQEYADACRHIVSGDTEVAAARDGRCQSMDDNLQQFGADGDCGSIDDPYGDGVCDADDNCVSTYNPSQTDGDGDGAGNSCDATACPSLYAYVAGEFGDVSRYDLQTGQGNYLASAGSQPRGVEIDPNETTGWVAVGSGSIQQFTLPGGSTTQYASGLSDPWGLAYDSASGRLYVTENSSGELSYINSGFPFTITGGLSSPRGVAMGSSSSVVLVAEHGAGQLVQIDPFGNPSPVVKATGLSSPMGVAYDPVLDVAYVTEAGSGELSRVTLSGGPVTTVASGLSQPFDVALDASGAFAYVTSSQGFIMKVEIATGSYTFVGFSFGGLRGVDLGATPPPKLSVPDGITTSPGASIPIDVTLENVTGLGVLSADLTVEWNDEVLTATAVAPGTLAAGCSVTSNLTLPGRAVISVFCTTPFSGAGSLVTVTFDVVGQRGEGTPLALTGILGEGTPSVCLDSGSLELPVSIDGRIAYYRDAGTSSEPGTAAVPFVNVALNRVPYDPFLNAGTACDGTYSIPSISAGSGYEVLPLHYTGYAPAIDPFDASLNAQHVVGLISLTPNQQLAADVTGNGTLSSLDSAKIAQMSVGLISQFPVEDGYGRPWAFVPTPQSEPNQTIHPPSPSTDTHSSITYTPLMEDAEDQDFLGVLFGDVSGNWAPDPCLSANKTHGAESLRASAGVTQPSVRVALPDLTGRPGGTIEVPVRVTGGGGVLSMYLDIAWDPSILKWRRASAGATGGSFSVTANGTEPGRARLALYSVTPLTADGDLVVLSFEVTGRPRSSSALTIEEARINEGGLGADLTGGSVTVRSPVKRGGDAPHRERP